MVEVGVRLFTDRREKQCSLELSVSRDFFEINAIARRLEVLEKASQQPLEMGLF